MIKFYKLPTAMNQSDYFLMELNRTTGKITHIEVISFETEIIHLDIEFADAGCYKTVEFTDEFRHLEIS